MHLALAVHHQVILDLGDSFQTFQNDSYSLVAFTAGWSCPHHQGVEVVEAPGCVKHEQLLALLCQAKLVECVVEVQYRLSITASELMPQLRHRGYGKLGGLHRVLHGPGVQIDSDLLLVPLLACDDGVADPSPSPLWSQRSADHPLLLKLVQVLSQPVDIVEGDVPPFLLDLLPELEKVKSVSGNLRIGPKTFCENAGARLE